MTFQTPAPELAEGMPETWIPLPGATLTPEQQLENRRAANRINQRYARARQKNKIATLEKQNKTLTQQLEDVQKKFSDLEEKYKALQAAVDAARSLLGPGALPQIGVTETQTPQVDPSLTSLAPPDPLPGVDSTPLLSTSDDIFDIPIDFETEFLNARSPTPTSPGLNAFTINGHFHDKDDLSGPGPSWAISLDAAARAGLDSQRLLMNSISNASDGVPVWRSLPLHLPPTNATDKILIDVPDFARQWKMHSGEHYEELLQKSFPSMSSLLVSSANDGSSNPISMLVGKHATMGLEISSFPSRVAYYYIVAQLVRWLVCQSQEAFELLPDFLKPTRLQRNFLHPPWLDVFPG